ncbi:MAG TPA: hypothetical protein VFG00_03705, partial [Acidothermaceae bacterium]|nr:hypothetical protein [Acidothermaceae bacterium]
ERSRSPSRNPQVAARPLPSCTGCRSSMLRWLSCSPPTCPSRLAVPKLIDALARAQADAAMLVDDAGRRQPLLAAYRTDALRRCSAGRDWRGASVRALTEGLTVVEVAAVGDEALDCDTPEQLTAAQEAATLPPTG